MSHRTHPAAADQRRWPSDPAMLVDTTRCPACFSSLNRAVCDSCGLRLDVPAAADLLAAGTRVRDAEHERQGIITRMRAEQAAAAARAIPPAPPIAVAPGASAPAAALPAVAAAPAEAPSATLPSMPVAAPIVPAPASAVPAVTAAPAGAAGPDRPRRPGVQVLLLTLGVVLLAVAAIVFLLVAYLIATLEVRSIVIAAASVLVLALSWLLRARGLPGTAEGVAALAVVLLVLDIWIIRANELFLSDRLDTPGYWGAALLLLAALLAGARLVSRVRVPGVAAAALAPIGLAVFAYGIPPRGETATGVWLGGTAVLVAAAAARFGRPSIERALLVWSGLAGGAIALVAAPWALDGVAWSPTWALLGIAAAWLVMLVALRMRSVDAWPKAAPLAAAMAGVAAAAAPALGAAVELDGRDSLWIGPAAAGAVACAAAATTRIRVRWAGDGFAAFVASASVAAVAAIPAALVAAVFAVPLAATPLQSWTLDPLESRGTPDSWIMGLGDLVIGAVLAPLALGIAAAIAFAVLGRLRTLGAVPTGLALWAWVAAAVTASTLLGVVGLLQALAVVALALAALRPTHRVPGAVLVLAVFGIGSASVGWALSHGGAGLWWWTVPVVVALAVAGRVLATRIWPPTAAAGAGALHLAAASVVTALGAFAAPAWADAAGRPLVAPWADGAFVAGLVAAAVLAAMAVVPRLRARDRVAVAAPMFLAGLLGAVAAAGSTADISRLVAVTFDDAGDATPFGWVPATTLALVGLLWLRSTMAGMRLAFAAAIPVVLGVAGSALVGEYGRPELVVHGVAGAALLAAALAHVVLPRDARVRTAWSIAAGVVGLLALQFALLPPAAPTQTWLALLILAPVPIVIAALYGDPFAGDAPASHVSWASLALAVTSVWARLAIDGVREVEAYTIPLAAALAAAGALLMWRGGTDATTAPGRTSVLGAAFAVAVLPSVVSAGGSELRTLVLVSAGSVAVLAGLFLPDRVRGVPLRLLVVAAGWTAATGAALVRGIAIARGGPSTLVPEVWPLIALAIGVVAVVVWARSDARPAAIAEWGLAASVAVASLPTSAAILAGDRPELRAGLLFSGLAALHVASVAVRARPIAGPVVRWASLGVMALTGMMLFGAGAVDPFDLVTVPLGVALVVAGAIGMRRTPTLGSWPALGPGLAVILLPALVADWTDPVLWRLVALGIVAVAVVVAGAVLRLQAPALLGGAVLLVHAITQLWPWISRLYEAVWWWLWLGLAGALLVVIAATYERQVRLARGAVRTIASLR